MRHLSVDLADSVPTRIKMSTESNQEICLRKECERCRRSKKLASFRFIVHYRKHRNICRACEAQLIVNKRRSLSYFVKRYRLNPRLLDHLQSKAHVLALRAARRKILSTVSTEDANKYMFSETVEDFSTFCVILLFLSFPAALYFGQMFYFLIFCSIVCVGLFLKEKFYDDRVAHIHFRINDLKNVLYPSHLSAELEERRKFENSLMSADDDKSLPEFR